MSDLMKFVLLAMNALAPGRDHSVLAEAISTVVQEEGCLFDTQDCPRRTAALLVAIAFRESTLRVDAENKKEGSVCAFQIWKGPRSLLSDPSACALAGYRRVKESLITCRGSIAAYASGSCTNAAGRRVDIDRKRLALRILEGR